MTGAVFRADVRSRPAIEPVLGTLSAQMYALQPAGVHFFAPLNVKRASENFSKESAALSHVARPKGNNATRQKWQRGVANTRADTPKRGQCCYATQLFIWLAPPVL
jgi:hypothetical protein